MAFFEILSTWNTVLVKDIATKEEETIRKGMDRMIKNAEDLLAQKRSGESTVSERRLDVTCFLSVFSFLGFFRHELDHRVPFSDLNTVSGISVLPGQSLLRQKRPSET